MPAKKYRNTKRLKAHERIKLILENARIIIVKEGFSQFSSRTVAERSGIRLATLQYYFKTTDDLFRATYESALDRERKRIDNILKKAVATPEGRLKAGVIAQYRACRHEDTAGFFFQLWARANIDDFAAGLMQDFYKRNTNNIKTRILGCNSSISEKEAGRRAILIMSLLEGTSLFAAPRHQGIARKFGLTEKAVVATVMDIVYT